LTAGIDPIYMDNPTYLSEKETADRNFALGYFMKENKGTKTVFTLNFFS